MFDKKELFASQIEDKLAEVGRLCNRLRIPFVWVAAVADDGKETKYKTVIEAGENDNPPDAEYICDGVTPGAMEIPVSDDRIREIIKIMNGFTAVPKNNGLVISEEGFVGDFTPRRLSSFITEGMAPLSSDADDIDYNYGAYDANDGYENTDNDERTDKDGVPHNAGTPFSYGYGHSRGSSDNRSNASAFGMAAKEAESPFLPSKLESVAGANPTEEVKDRRICYEGESDLDL